MTAPALVATVLSLDAVTAGYGGTTVLRDVSLEVPAGSVTALLGPNGAGKTTLLRVAAGLVRPTAGRVLRAGDEVTRTPASARAAAGLCLIPEGRGIFPSLTVRENLSVPVKRRDRATAVDRAVTCFPALAGRLDQVAGTLSGGQQQMVAMARCYVGSPDIILLDEVSMGLAPLVVDEIYASIESLTGTGTALVLVEQYVDRALAIADTVHVLSRGRLAFSGPPGSTSREELMSSYLSPLPDGRSVVVASPAQPTQEKR